MKKFLLIFFLLINSAFAEDTLQKVRIDLFDGGQDSANFSAAISPSSGSLFKNIVNSKKGQLSKRKGQSLFSQDVSNTAFTGIGSFYPDANTTYITAASGVSVIRSTPAGVNYTIVNPSNNLTTGKDTEFVQANDLLFVLNGQDYTANYSGSAWDPGSSSTASPPVGTTAVWLRNYLFVGGIPTELSWVRFSNNLAPRTFTITDLFKVNSGDGQKVTKLESFKLNELIIYKERSIYLLDITGATPLTDWTIQPVTTVIGCEAPRSVTNIGNDHWFLSSAPIAVRTLSRTAFDKLLVNLVSKPVQDIFDGTGDTVINLNQYKKSCAILFDNKYFLAIPTGSSTVNNYVVVYDFITNSWFIINGWFPSDWQVVNNRLFYTDANDGRIIECWTGTVGDMASGPIVTSSLEPSAGISYEYISKDINFDSPENYKQLDALDVEFEPTGSYTSTIYIDLDNGGFQNIGTINLFGGGVILPVSLPFTLGANGRARKTFQLQRYGEFKTIRIKVLQEGLSEQCNLYSFTLFARIKPWRRE
mgnify:CR=1 FL=1